MTAIIHIAGLQVQVGSRLRQRCAWCGTTLLDYDLARVAVPEGQDPRPGMWTPQHLISVDGPVSFPVPHEDGADLPGEACANIDDEVTV